MERLGAEKIIYHAERLIDFREKGDTYPIHMIVGLTEYCCHKCVFCHSEFATANTTKNSTLGKETLLKFLKEAKTYGLKAVTLVGSGEPLLHPEIEDILLKIKELGIDIGIFTNGSKIDESLSNTILETCTFIRFSVNASCAEEHEKVHRVKNDFDNVVGNIYRLVEMKKNKKAVLPTIGTQMVFYEENYQSIVRATELWKKIGVDYFEIKPVINGEGSAVNVTVRPAKDQDRIRQLMDEAKKLEDGVYSVYAKYKQYKETQGTNIRRYGKCYEQALCINLLADGNLYLCVDHEQEKDILGNIYENSFLEIWHGKQRHKVLERLDFKNCPGGCYGHNMNEIIWDFLHPDETIHPNFI